MDLFGSLKKLLFEPEVIKRTLLVEEYYQPNQLVFHTGFLESPSCVSFDPVRKLLLTGSQDGFIKIHGSPSVESFISSKIKGPILSLWMTINGYIIVGFQFGVEVWNIPSRELIHSWEFKSDVTSIYHPFGTDHAYIGLSSGIIQLVNPVKGIAPPYPTIECKNVLGSVVEMHCNPEYENILLIGFYNVVVEWDLTLNALRQEYPLGPLKPLRSLAWNHDGTKFAVGHDDGLLSFWKHGKTTPLKKSFLEQKKEDGIQRRPITKIAYTRLKGSSGEFSCCLVLGGGPMKEQRSIYITILKDEKIMSCSLINPKDRDLDVVSFTLIFNSPWLNDAVFPSYLIYVTTTGKLMLHSIAEFKFVQVPPPLPLKYQQQGILQSQFLMVTEKLLRDFYEINNIKWDFEKRPWPILGGELFSNSNMPTAPPRFYKLLITVHLNSSICFWDGTTKTLILLYKLNVSDKLYGEISCFSFCVVSRRLIIGTSQGHILLFEFSLKERLLETWTYGIEKPTRKESRPPPSLQLPKEQEIGSQQVLAGSGEVKKEEESALPMNPPVATAPEEPPKAKIRSTNPFDDDYEPPSQENIETPNEPQNPQNTISNPVATATTQDKPVTETTVTQQSSDTPQPPPPSQELNSLLSPLAHPPQPPEPVNSVKAEPGFQLTEHIKWPNAILNITLSAGLQKFAFGDTAGRLTEFNWGNEPGLVFSKEIDVSCTIPIIRFYVHQTATGPLVLMYFTTSDGRVLVLDTVRGTITSAIKDIRDPLKLFLCVSSSGKILDIVEPVHAEVKPVKEIQNYLLVCSTKSISFYALPTLEKTYHIDLTSQIVWANVLHVKEGATEEGCIVVIDENQFILLYTIPTLELISITKSYRVSDIVNKKTLDTLTACCSDGDTIFYGNKEWFRVRLFPRLTGEQRGPNVYIPTVPLPPKQPPKQLPKPGQGGLISQLFNPPSLDLFSKKAKTPQPSKAIGEPDLKSPLLKSTTNPTTPLPPPPEIPPPKGTDTERKRKEGDKEELASPRRAGTSVRERVEKGTTIAEVNQQMQRNVQALNERGQRINDIGLRTQELANESAQLASAARRLKEKQSKNWFF